MATRNDFTADFYTEPESSYLNCAYHGAIPNVAVEAMQAAALLKQAPYRLPDTAHFEFPAAYRQAVAQLIGGSEQQVVIGDSATHGIMLLVRGLQWQAGDEVIIPQNEFPANKFPWQALEPAGVVLRQVDLSEAQSWLGNIEAALSERTRVISVSWVSYSTGFRLDLEAVSALCRDRGILLVIDGSQGVGGLRFDVNSVPFDLLSCATYKFLLGPYGVGFSYVSKPLLEELTTSNINWMRVKGADDFNRLSECDLDLVADASRFDVNETASFFNLAAGTASLRYLQRIGPGTVEDHVAALLLQLAEALPEGYRVMSDSSPQHRSNIFCIRGKDEKHTCGVFEALQAARVFTSMRDGNLRISPHLYNTPRDIDRLLEVLGSQ
jgi:cysteine desulfurase/selenocysteine lyase